jgi:hypothetical protein
MVRITLRVILPSFETLHLNQAKNKDTPPKLPAPFPNRSMIAHRKTSACKNTRCIFIVSPSVTVDTLMTYCYSPRLTFWRIGLEVD